ncbi:Adenine guanine permease AZG1 [Chlorella sorokiniana]|uniref:Adenine guanine permease AZG1 n=1 Tax=Chlorella sorokiniana TaxID=3076 RepID=A0A2P6TBB2_CHLSO|nr:Adenine guanine permease AZG1 [Chlorella sorokiniana]|eukprot:PRW05836.1 Adenine guanine permease AZG1 [Chlorella sorokiniana]
MSEPNGYDDDSELSSSEPPPTLWERLGDAVRAGASAVAGSAAAAATGVRDGAEAVRDGWHKGTHRADKWAANGVVGRAFQFKQRNAKFCTELRAGLITFLMVSYILAVNPTILATTGGTCDPETVCGVNPATNVTYYDELGPQCLANPDDPSANQCMTQLVRSLVTATAAASLISTFFIGYFGNLPLALAPGIGINAYVAYQVVGQFGDGELSYQQAMTAIFIEGWIFMILSVTGVRGGIVKFMPKSIAMASSVGIGMLLAFTGLRNLGLITFDSATLVTLGGCPVSHRNYLYAFPERLTPDTFPTYDVADLPAPATVYGCMDETMRSPAMWLGIAGGFLMCILLYTGIKGSLIIGIAFVTIISWIPGHGASYLGSSSPIPGGEQRMDVFKQVVAAPSLSATGLAWDWSAFKDGRTWLVLFTFLYIDLLDCTGTLLSMARLLDFSMPGFLTETMEFPGQMWAFLSDGIGIVTGSMMGTTPLTVYIESAAGIEDGGRTGLTALVVSFFFLVSLFFSPIIASIPPYATGPALVLVGTILLGHIAHIEWDDIGVAVPAFLTMVLMPFTYSVAYGVIAGLASYVAIHGPFWAWDYFRKRWRGGGATAESPRHARRLKRRMTGYHMRKTFGPPEAPPSRADSFVGMPGYQDSYHSQDTHRSGLPVTMMMGGGAAMGGIHGPGSHAGSVIGRSNPPSVAGFPLEGSTRGAAAAAAMLRGSIHAGASADGELPPPPSGVALMRKSYSMTAGRGTETAPAAVGAAAAALGFGRAGPRSLPVPYRAGARGLTDSGTPYIATSAVQRLGGRSLGHNLSMGALRGSGQGGSSSPVPPKPGDFARLRSKTFSHGLSALTADDDLRQQHSSSDHGGQLYQQYMQGRGRGTTGSEEGDMEGQPSFKLFGDVAPLALEGSGPARVSSELEDRRRSFKLFGEVEPMALSNSGAVGGSSELEDRRKSFKLFGDVEPMALSTSGAIGSGPFGSGPTGSGEADLQGQRSFRLFGDVEPLALSTSGAIEGLAADGSGGGGEDRGAPGGDSSKPELEPEQSYRLFGMSPLRISASLTFQDGSASMAHTSSFRLPTSSSDMERDVTADLTFGSASGRRTPQLFRDSMERARHGSTAYTDARAQTPEGGSLLAQAATQAAQAARRPSFGDSPAAGEAGGAEEEEEQQQQQQQQQQQAGGEGLGSPEPGLRRLSSEEQRAEDERHAAVYDKLVRTLSRNSLRGRSPAPRPVGQGDESAENGSVRSLSRSSSLAGQRGQLRSSSLAAAAHQLARLSSQGEVASPQSGSGAPSPVRLGRLSSAGGVPSPVPPVLARISSQAGTPETSQPTSPVRAAERHPALPPSPFGGELPRHLRHVQSMPPQPPGASAGAPPPQPFDAPAETRSAPHELRGAHLAAELDPYCSRYLSGLVGDDEEAG